VGFWEVVSLGRAGRRSSKATSPLLRPFTCVVESWTPQGPEAVSELAGSMTCPSEAQSYIKMGRCAGAD
jgi:hypothetical protein